jgi:hypothetical protein
MRDAIKVLAGTPGFGKKRGAYSSCARIQFATAGIREGCAGDAVQTRRRGRRSMTPSILNNIRQDQITAEPFPHVHVPDALDKDYYEALAAGYPVLQDIAGARPMQSNQAYLLSARDVLHNPSIPDIWRNFFAYHTSAVFFREMVNFWLPFIDREYPDLSERFGKPVSALTTAIRQRSKEKTSENLKADMMLDCQFGMNSPVTRFGSVRGPHIDKPYKLFAALIYFRHPDDDYAGGDLDLYRSTRSRYPVDARLNVAERYVTRFKTIPYRPNTLIMWLNTPQSLHGVSPRPVTDVPRRYVNILAESYRLESDGFFSVRQGIFTRGIAAVKRATGFRNA